MSLLPKLNDVPKYNIIIPSNNQDITVRPFLVKEEKIMLIALESQDPKQIARAVLDTVTSCIMDDVNVNALTSYDVEYLFLQLRCKSVGETTDLLLKCDDCAHENKVNFNLNDIKMNVKSIQNKVKIITTKKVKKILIKNKIDNPIACIDNQVMDVGPFKLSTIPAGFPYSLSAFCFFLENDIDLTA